MLFEPFLYPTQKLCSFSLFHFVSILEDIQLIFCCILDYSTSQSFSSNLHSFSKSKFILFEFLFQYQIINFSSILLVLFVLSLSLSILSCVDLDSELASSFLFLKDLMKVVQTTFKYWYCCFNYMMIKSH